MSPVPSSTAVSSSRRVAASSAATRGAKSACSRRVSDMTGGSGSVPRRCAPVSVRGSSTSASGFPAASRNRRPTTAGTSSGRCARRTWSASASSSGPSASSDRPARSKKLSSCGLEVTISAARLSARRRATKLRTNALERSSHMTSSTASRSGSAAAARRTRATVASATATRSTTAASSKPKATESTSPRRGSRARMVWLSGRTSWLRLENAMSASNSTPEARSTRAPASAASCAAASSSTDLPMPGAPVTTSAPPRPEAAAATSERSAGSSPSRPTSGT